MKRCDMLAAMDERSTRWDVIIVGGGATGLGAAVEAASRGHRTLLVEAGDFARGTSSRSTKLIHGGVRYLRQARIGMVRQSLLERQRLFRNAPHIVHSLDFVLPTYRWGSRAFYYAGLRLYDALAGQWITGRAQRLSRDETREKLPTLQDHGLRGGVLYADGQFDDSRLAIALARTAVDHGATVVNYTPVVRLLKTNGRVAGVVVRDLDSDRELSLQGRVVLNATGVFADNILQMDLDAANSKALEDTPTVAPSQGSHLVLDASFLPGSNAMMIPETDDGRVLFIIPWHGKVLLGTTDLAVDKVSAEPRPLQSEVEYLLEHAGRYLRRQPTESDICSRFAGLRPLVGRKAGSKVTSSVSREHEIFTSDSGLISVIGGKWTTYRHMGEELIDQAETAGGLTKRRSTTADLKLHGCPEVGGTSRLSLRQVNQMDVDADSGAIQEVATLQDHAGLQSSLHCRLPYRAADVVHAARYEMAQSVEDVLARRTRALFLDAKAALEAAPHVAALLQQELGKPPEWTGRQLESFTKVASGYLGLPSD